MTRETTTPGAAASGVLPPPPVEQAAADALRRSGESYARACLDWQQELARFATRRWLADLRLPLEAARCRDAVDLMTLQQRWLAEAMEDYSSEAGQLARIAERATRDSLGAIGEVGREAEAEAESREVIG